MTKRILIVDDSDQLRKALRAALESELGVTCTEARNGRDAVNRARELNPDLIVLDLSMPVMNGLDAAPHLKRLLPAFPIVISRLFIAGSTVETKGTDVATAREAIWAGATLQRGQSAIG